MRVFVLGGTGAIGRHAVPALVGAGHGVRALARTPQKARWLEQQGAVPVEVSIFDPAALADVFAGYDAVVNLTSAMPAMRQWLSTRAFAANRRVRTEGSAAVANAAITAGVPRLVQESVSMLYPDRGHEWIDENTPVDHYPMAIANLAAEGNAQRFAGTGGDAVVLRFGLFYGPGAAHSEEMLDQARHHVAMVLGNPEGYLSSIHVADAASAVVAVLRAPVGTYNVVDDEPLTKRAFAEALGAAAGSTLWFKGPGRSAALLGSRVTSLTRSLRVSNSRLRRTTGWAPRYPDARDGLVATAAELERQTA